MRVRQRVVDMSGVAEARRACVKEARDAGFRESDAGRVAIVATELASNLVKHAGGGAILVGPFEDSTGSGIEVASIDKGPGIADLAQSMRDGFSTAGSPGTGIGAVKRLAQYFEISSQLRIGTAALARMLPGRSPAPILALAPWGGLCMPKLGEEACGDAWAAVPHDGSATLLIVDGLGHGPDAAGAAHEAIR